MFISITRKWQFANYPRGSFSFEWIMKVKIMVYGQNPTGQNPTLTKPHRTTPHWTKPHSQPDKTPLHS